MLVTTNYTTNHDGKCTPARAKMQTVKHILRPDRYAIDNNLTKVVSHTGDVWYCVPTSDGNMRSVLIDNDAVYAANF